MEGKGSTSNKTERRARGDGNHSTRSGIHTDMHTYTDTHTHTSRHSERSYVIVEQERGKLYIYVA